MLVGIAYDVYRCIRKIIKRGRWLTALLDTLFIITLGLVVVFVLYTANQGELRLYTFIGFALGFALYIAGVSPFVQYIAYKVKKWMNKRNNK